MNEIFTEIPFTLELTFADPNSENPNGGDLTLADPLRRSICSPALKNNVLLFKNFAGEGANAFIKVTNLSDTGCMTIRVLRTNNQTFTITVPAKTTSALFHFTQTEKIKAEINAVPHAGFFGTVKIDGKLEMWCK